MSHGRTTPPPIATDPFLTDSRQAAASQPENQTLRRDNSQPELTFPFQDRQEGSLAGHVKDYSRLPELPIRKLTVQVMNALAEERLLEEEWQKKPQQHLDFSDRNLFQLESLRPEDFAWGGLVKNREGKEDVRRVPGGEPVMPVYKLRTLNLDNNELTDDDFEPWTNKVSSKGLSGVVFRNLEVLRMKKNRLTYPMLIMPRLRELHLSYNDIVRIPPLAGLKQLEVLVLSHNKIDAIDDHHLKDTNNLKKLHLNDNKLKLDASSLYGVLDSLSTARDLEHLHFQGNPFCSYLNEYQIIVVMFLSQLKRLDDIDLSKSKSLRASMLEEARRAGMDRDRDREDLKRELQKLDAQVKLRMKSETSKTRSQGVGRAVLPKIDSLIHELDEALIDGSNIQTSAALVYELASQLTKDGSGNYNTVCHYLFDVRQKKAGEDPRAVKEGFAATFVQQVTLLAERFPDVRPLLLRTLAKFCPMEPNRFGELCLGALATLAKGGADRQREVLNVVQEMLVPLVAEKSVSNPVGDSSWETVVVGLSKLSCPELGDIMSDSVVPYLGVWYKYVMAQTHSKLKSALIVLLRCAAQVKEHALKVIDERFLREMCQSLLSLKWWQSDLFSDFLGVGGILAGCIQSCQDKVIPILRSIEFPRKLLKVVRGVVDESNGKDELATHMVVLSKKIGASLRLLNLMLQDPALLQEQVSLDKEEKKLMGHTLLVAPCKALPDPLVLASSLECLHLLLKDTSGCRLYLELVVSQLLLDKNPNKVLPFISVKRFQDVISLCERHTALQDDAALSFEGVGATHQSQLVDFTTATDTNAHAVIVSIVHFISVFPAMADEFEMCKQVSQKMNEQGRETLLFKLLGTPSNDVRMAVLQFLETATDELEISEQKQLVDMLNTAHVGQELPLLKSLLETLQRFICKDGEIGDVFRSTYAGTVILKAFQVLCVNAERNTYGNQIEEEQKLSLSREAVALLVGASQQPLLRMVKHPSDPDEELLRCEEIASEFCRIMQFEENLHRPSMHDVPLELMWTGRHVPILLRFLNPTSSEAIQSGRKQGFRIFAQIADIVAGLQRGLDGDWWQPVAAKTLPTSAKDRAEAESEMWNVTTMRLQINRLDDHAYSDRYHQQDNFVSFHGLEQMLHFLEHGISHHNFSREAGHLSNGAHHNGHWESLVSAMGTPGQAGSANARAVQRPVVRAVEAQKQAKDHLLKIVGHVNDRKLEKAQEQREQAQKEDPEVIPLPAVAKAPTLVGEALARKFFIEDAWKHSLQPDAVSLRGNVVPVVPHHLRAHHEVAFVDAHGHVGLHYYVAAMLRAIYAIFVAPMDPRFKEAMARQLQNSTMHSRLMALMEVCGSFVNCNVVAKFLRIMSIVLRLPPHDFRGADSDTGGLHSEVLVAAKFACRCICMVAPLLESVGREYALSQEQQALMQEAIRLLRSVGHFATSIRFTDVREIQAECMEMAFDVALPMQAVRGIFMCLLYDVQAGIGMQHGPGISKHFVESILGRQEFHELCSEVLSLVVTSSEKTRYEVLELCNRFKVLKRQGLHTSFLKQLIDYTEIHGFALAMQQALDRQPAVEEERATEFFLGEWEAKSHPGGESVGISFLATTDFLITAFGRPNQSAMSPLKVNLWSVASKKVVASTEIGPQLDDDERQGRYIYQTLETPVRIECGKEYRLVQESPQGTETSWHDGYINPTEAAALVSNTYASLLGGVSGQLYSYPAHFDGELRRAGMLNFVIEQKESIRHCLDVEILEYGGGTYGLGFSSTSRRPHQRMVITNKRLLLMEVPRGGFNTLNLQGLTAGISQAFWLSNLIRISCQTDTQMFILGFMEASRLGSVNEHLMCVICHRSDVRQRVMETLTELSGPSLQVRIHPTRDVLMHQAIAKRMSSQILCMTYAFSGDSLRFYVLTNTELCEFELHFESWVPSPKVIPYTGYEDILGSKDDAKLVKRIKEEQQRGNFPISRFAPPFGDRLNQRAAALDATMTNFYQVDHEDFLPGVAVADPEQQKKYEQDLKMFREAQQQTLTMVQKPPLSQLREVEFDTGELPALKLKFKKFKTDTETINMRFMDDVARERWRRCLAVALRGQSDHAEHWDRHWTAGASQ